jgi:hypothetical protein
MYFSLFPTIFYDAVGNGDDKIVTHLLKRVAVHSKASETVALFDTYDVRNGETPEMIAHKYYDDAEYHWIVLLVNNITDRYHQWPMNTRQFLSHLTERYDNVDAVHHYEIYQESGDTSVKINIGTSNIDTDGNTIADATLITNREYEEEKQDVLRKIRLLDPEYLEQFVEEFERLVSETED